ncbi:hypothetical protein ANCDUO_10083 [Ancylostoma duodenale]|uniref:Peptidase M1 membrane alanine aminopeptidase domain-containing protein n=1 Tax=Ancylostoma duodenale TaxID=51022 RepID=A0A0C2GL51_9BILA|nr:hypothetical protein ANCDUO_10083 [Ancylostoma duodenale]
MVWWSNVFLYEGLAEYWALNAASYALPEQKEYFLRSAIMNVLSSAIPADVLQKGLYHYIFKKAYSNARPEKLWGILSEVCVPNRPCAKAYQIFILWLFVAFIFVNENVVFDNFMSKFRHVQVTVLGDGVVNLWMC